MVDNTFGRYNPFTATAAPCDWHMTDTELFIITQFYYKLIRFFVNNYLTKPRFFLQKKSATVEPTAQV